MRRRLFAAWMMAVVALSWAAVRPADDPTSSNSSWWWSTKRDRHVGPGGHLTSHTERYVDRKLDELETRFGRRLIEYTKRLNNSITIHYLEKVITTTVKL